MKVTTSLLLLLLDLLLLHCELQYGFPAETNRRNSTSPSYMLFAARNVIYKVNLDGTNLTEVVIDGSPDTIQGLAYHYRRGLMFWSSRRSNLVRQANFDGSGITDIATSVDTDDIADLKVDWVSDKLYWVDRGRREIVEHDIATAQQRVIWQGRCEQERRDCVDASPQAIAVFPDHNATTLWWLDTARQVLVTAVIHARQITPLSVRREYPRCNLLGPLDVDIINGRLYVVNRCSFSIQHCNINGSDWSTILRSTSSIDQLKTFRMTHIGSSIYWATSNRFYMLETNNRTKREILRLNNSLTVRALTIVDPSLQPVRPCPGACMGNEQCLLESRTCDCDEDPSGEHCSSSISDQSTTLPSIQTTPSTTPNATPPAFSSHHATPLGLPASPHSNFFTATPTITAIIPTATITPTEANIPMVSFVPTASIPTAPITATITPMVSFVPTASVPTAPITATITPMVSFVPTASVPTAAITPEATMMIPTTMITIPTAAAFRPSNTMVEISSPTSSSLIPTSAGSMSSLISLNEDTEVPVPTSRTLLASISQLTPVLSESPVPIAEGPLNISASLQDVRTTSRKENSVLISASPFTVTQALGTALRNDDINFVLVVPVVVLIAVVIGILVFLICLCHRAYAKRSSWSPKNENCKLSTESISSAPRQIQSTGSSCYHRVVPPSLNGSAVTGKESLSIFISLEEEETQIEGKKLEEDSDGGI